MLVNDDIDGIKRNFYEWIHYRNTLEKRSVIVLNRTDFEICAPYAQIHTSDVAFIQISASIDSAKHVFKVFNESLHFLKTSDNVLNLNFDDVTEDLRGKSDDGYDYVFPAMNEKQARKTYRFIKKNLGKHFVISCRAGKSRSQGICRAIYDLFPETYAPNEYNKVNPCDTPNYDVVAKIKRAAYNDNEKDINTQPRVFFISDLHFCHKDILKHCPERYEQVISYAYHNDFKSVPDDLMGIHDEWLIDMWNSTIKKKDTVYILGDFSFGSADFNAHKLLPKLNGKKYLILGNHDSTSDKLTNLFEVIDKDRIKTFKKSLYPFIEEEEGFRVFMSHYPMLAWEGSNEGVVNLHGHSHGRFDNYNVVHNALRVDVGIDGRLANYKPVPLEKVYKWYKETIGDLSGREYCREHREDDLKKQ